MFDFFDRAWEITLIFLQPPSHSTPTRPILSSPTMSSANLSTLDYESLSGLLTTITLIYGAYKIITLVSTYLERVHERIMASRRPARRGTLEMEQGVAGNPDTSGTFVDRSRSSLIWIRSCYILA